MKTLTSNCHLSTCSPVSLLVMTMTSLEILALSIHLLSCDMIFLMYALTWSSCETKTNQQIYVSYKYPLLTQHIEPIFLDTITYKSQIQYSENEETHVVKSSGGYTPRWNLWSISIGRDLLSSVFHTRWCVYSIQTRGCQIRTIEHVQNTYEFIDKLGWTWERSDRDHFCAISISSPFRASLWVLFLSSLDDIVCSVLLRIMICRQLRCTLRRRHSKLSVFCLRSRPDDQKR